MCLNNNVFSYTIKLIKIEKSSCKYHLLHLHHISCVSSCITWIRMSIHQHDDLIIRYMERNILGNWCLRFALETKNNEWKTETRLRLFEMSLFYFSPHLKYVLMEYCKLSWNGFSSNGFLMSRILRNRLIWKLTYQYFSVSQERILMCSSPYNAK